NESIQVLLRYNNLIENLTVAAQNSLEQYLPKENVEYRLYSIDKKEYLSEWKPLPENKTVSFGFYDEKVPEIPDFNVTNTWLMIIIIVLGFIFLMSIITYLAYKYYRYAQNYKKMQIEKVKLESERIRNFYGGKRIK
ncbi:MAG: hypothetical protein ACTSQP_23030, partial [Promethearchaeota archaeon]